MVNGIRKEDLADLDIVDSVELASDGYAVYLTTTLVSTTNGTNVVTINLPFDGEGLITGRDHPVASGDRVRLIGTSGGLADGYYLVDLPITDTSFSVTSSIATSTGGTIYFMFREGARQVGFDPTGLSLITAHNVQDAIREVAFNASGISESVHKTLRHLIHFINEGPGDGFASGAYKTTLPEGDPFPTSIIWWESSAQTEKIVEKTLTLNPNKTPSQIEWKMYDTNGTSVIATATDSITYSGIFEINRTRVLS
jgi:hypothetical protein